MKSFLFRGFGCAVFVLMSCAGVARAESPNPLYERMKGIWVGEGQRVASVSGKVVSIRTETHAAVESGALVSRNHLTETADGEGKTYLRAFWVRPAPGVLEILEGEAFDIELGYGEEPGIASAGSGKYARDSDGVWMLKVVQPMGSGYRVVSISRFVDHETVEYLEQFLQDDRVLARTRVSYERVWLGQTD